MKIKTKAFEIMYTACESIERVNHLDDLLSLQFECEKDGNGSILYVVVEIKGVEHKIELHQDQEFWG